MIRLPIRLACNLVYMHLRPAGQAPGCVDACPPPTTPGQPACPRCDFHRQLEAPVTEQERREAERREARVDAVLSGDITG